MGLVFDGGNWDWLPSYKNWKEQRALGVEGVEVLVTPNSQQRGQRLVVVNPAKEPEIVARVGVQPLLYHTARAAVERHLAGRTRAWQLPPFILKGEQKNKVRRVFI